MPDWFSTMDRGTGSLPLPFSPRFQSNFYHLLWVDSCDKTQSETFFKKVLPGLQAAMK